MPAPLRTDLVIRAQAGRDGAVFVVKDPVRGRYFRFGPAEHAIARRLVAGWEPDAVRAAVEAELGAALSAETLDRFVDRLDRLGLLATGPAAAPGRVRGDPLYLRVKLADPSALLDRLDRWLGFLFTPGFVALSGALVATGAAIAVGHHAGIVREISAMAALHSALLGWAVLIAVIVAHELAHGLACRHFGGEVREVGFMLIYFHPAFYCNVSDAWLFPAKAQRLWVTFAGAWLELCVWAAAAWTWWLADPASPIARPALLVLASSGLATAFNLNPLLKLDGYYLLSDWLEVPNLRARAFAWWRARLSGSPSWATLREGRIFAAYGLLAGAFSAGFLVLVLTHLGGALVRRFHGWGLVLLVGLVLLMFRAPVAGAIRQGMTMRPTLWTAVRWGAAALLLGPIPLVPTELEVAGGFTLSAARTADVRAPLEGTLDAIAVRQGARVGAGDPIARLADQETRTEAREVQARIDERSALLRMHRAGPTAEELQVAWTTRGRAEEALRYAEAELGRLEPLHGAGVVAADELADARQAVALRRKDLEEASGRLAVVRSGTRAEEIEAIAAEITRLRAREQYLQEQLGAMEVTSPIAGVVTTPRVHERVGEVVRRGDLIATVQALDAVIAEIAVPEAWIPEVAVGQPVRLRARAWPDARFEGRVTAIAPVATPPAAPGLPTTVTVTATFDDPTHRVMPEMTGTARIACGRRSVGAIAVRTFRTWLRG